MNITSMELWDMIEVDLINLKNRNDLDPILCQRFESFINHYNGCNANGKLNEVLEELRTITYTLSSKNFYSIRNIDKKDVEALSKLNENLILLDKILVQEIKINLKAKQQEQEHKEVDRLPNIDNDKVMNLFKRV